MSSTSASIQLPPQSKESPESGNLSQLILPLKPSFRPGDFERVMQTLNARDEAARRDTAYWKAQYEAMEKKHGEAELEKLIALDEVTKLNRERDLLQNQVARADNDRRLQIERMEEDQNSRMARFKEDQKAGRERERGLDQRYARLWEDFNKMETEKAKLGCKVSALEFEREKAKREAEESGRRFDELNRRVSRLEEDAALLMSAGPGVEERSERREERSDVSAAADELVVDGKEGGSGGGDGSSEEILTELPVKESGLSCGEKAEAVVPGRGGSGPGSVEAGTGSMVVIEIDDSDDEMPTRKRGLSIDDSENVKPTKKHHTKSLIELMDEPGGSDSSDTGDSSGSGSDIDINSEIARLRRKVAEKKTWAFKVDMMSALERDPELCMNAVCALYRKQLCKVESVSGSSLGMNPGFNQFDALRNLIQMVLVTVKS
ncbi:uncharacterized protein LOC131332643 isoform X2 [Rhododendron vialii]|uniref:uncharacterized protein LOC131332643 isoform X2 n=1 Tax=Rhododendron vialii TaxID=182163 RepID=UPI0026603AB5|nr:uncharacterized protein LOC131332643 isoform X2 [Rhododendron vialii]